MIELVIKIPERDYDLACNYPDMLIATYAHYIKDGIPLPKGHGELVDKEVVLDMMNHGILEEYITTMVGVIPADK